MREKNPIEARILVPWTLQEETALFLRDLSGRDVIVEDERQPEGGSFVRALLESMDKAAELRGVLEDYLHRLGSYGIRPLDMEFRPALHRDWIEEYRARTVVRPVGSLWLLRAPWMECEVHAGRKVIVLHEGGAFGSGRHPSTVLSLEALEQAWRSGLLPSPTPGWNALDVGTGTGILAIAAAYLGAEVVAVDIDDRAVAEAQRNLCLNGLQGRVRVEERPLGLVKGRFRLVLANVALPAQLELAPCLNRLLLPGGVAIVSGFLVADADALADRYEREGLQAEFRRNQDDWASMTLRFHDPAADEYRRADDRNVSPHVE